MKVLLFLTLFILSSHLRRCKQPYFPSQIVFSPDNSRTLNRIDEISQRTYQTMRYSHTE